jgi:hypothetical protein
MQGLLMFLSSRDNLAVLLVLAVLAIIFGVYFSGINNGPPACKHLIGFYQRHDGTLKNVYAPCHKDVCDADPMPKDCG